MTRDEILNLTPEQLGDAIAECRGHVEGVGPMYQKRYGGIRWFVDSNGNMIPDPTAEISAAWELVEEAHASNKTVSISNTLNSHGDDWFVSIGFTHYFQGSFPIAICRAWLMWRKGEDESI